MMSALWQVDWNKQKDMSEHRKTFLCKRMGTNTCSLDDGNVPLCNPSVIINSSKESMTHWLSHISVHQNPLEACQLTDSRMPLGVLIQQVLGGALPEGAGAKTTL